MSRADLIDVLRRLKFDVDDHCLVWLDRPVRDLLITALTNTRRK